MYIQVTIYNYARSLQASGSILDSKTTHRRYVVGSKSFRPDVQKPRQMENAVRDI
jgi:hypothetical protein